MDRCNKIILKTNSLEKIILETNQLINLKRFRPKMYFFFK